MKEACVSGFKLPLKNQVGMLLKAVGHKVWSLENKFLLEV